MERNFDLLFNSDFPRQLDGLCDLIDEIREEIEAANMRIEISKKKYLEEYGFNIYSSTKKKWIFFGIWYDLWTTFAAPLCITLDWDKKVDPLIRDKLRETVNKFSAKSAGISFQTYQSYPTIIFNQDYFHASLVKENLLHLIHDVNDSILSK